MRREEGGFGCCLSGTGRLYPAQPEGLLSVPDLSLPERREGGPDGIRVGFEPELREFVACRFKQAFPALALSLQIPQVRLRVGQVHVSRRLFVRRGRWRQTQPPLRSVDEEGAGEREQGAGDTQRARKQIDQFQRNEEASREPADPGPPAETDGCLELASRLLQLVTKRRDSLFRFVEGLSGRQFQDVQCALDG